VLIGLQLNFANLIALPLLLGVGVAFKIYYVIAWRSGETDFLQSSLTRAILFSACTTAIAFGSLWLSHHPGTSSMGKLMAPLARNHADSRRHFPAGTDGDATEVTPNSAGPVTIYPEGYPYLGASHKAVL